MNLVMCNRPDLSTEIIPTAEKIFGDVNVSRKTGSFLSGVMLLSAFKINDYDKLQWILINNAA